MNYLKIYNQLIEKRKLNPANNNVEKHHIKPKSLYPELAKDKDNIVCLTYREHYIAHWLLYRYYQSINDKNATIKMGFALFRLCKNTNGLHVTSKQYERAQKINLINNIQRSKEMWSNKEFRNKMKKIKNSAEYKYKQHISKVGRHLAEETKIKIANANKGRTITAEQRKKISDSHKIVRQTKEWKDKMSNIMKNAQNTDQAILNHRKTRLCKAVKIIETNEIFYSSKEAERQTGICQSNILLCCKGKRNIAGGYHWKYV